MIDRRFSGKGRALDFVWSDRSGRLGVELLVSLFFFSLGYVVLRVLDGLSVFRVVV